MDIDVDAGELIAVPGTGYGRANGGVAKTVLAFANHLPAHNLSGLSAPVPVSGQSA
jgi:hypothetical protein